jgi:hypothetical protein
MFRFLEGASVALFVMLALPIASSAQATREQVAQFEAVGDLNSAKALLARAAESNANDPLIQESLAEFLCRHGELACHDATTKWASVETDATRKKLAQRQLLIFDYMNGKDTAADLQQYQSLGGTELSSPTSREHAGYSLVTVPGPLASFARMAALSPDLAPEDLLPALARNVVTNGYEASGNEALQQTEYLRLLTRYVSQARELQQMATKDGKIVISTCDSEETGALLKVLGYRMRGSCGADIVLETVNPTRAFLTVDSAFPLTQLEQDLRANHRFELPYAGTKVPVLYNAEYWLAALNRQGQTDFLDAFLSDPSLCRLYLGLSHLDRATAEALRKQASPVRLKVYSHVLDFFGGMFQIRNGSAVVPGSPKAWASLVGVNPSNPGAFFEKLMSFDDGWLASYFDCLSRISGPTLTYLVQPDHLKRNYEALRGKVTSPGPARPVFRSSTDLMLLTNSLRIDSNGEAHVPGNLEVWRNLFIHHPHGKYDGKLTRSAQGWKSSEDLIEALFGLSRKSVENEPLKIFLALNDVDRDRLKPLSAEMASRLISDYRLFGAQYILFADSPTLSEASMTRYLDWAAASIKIHDNLLRADALGSSQALVELWRILSRQDTMPLAARDEAFSRIISPFAQVKQEADVFEAARAGVNTLLAATGKTSGSKQERLLELLVGRVRPGVPTSPAENFLRVFDAQRLVSLDGLFLAADRLDKGAADPAALKALNEQLTRLEETEPTRGSLSAEEKNTLAVGYWSERHVEQERKLNIDSLMKGTDKKDPKGALAPFLRDSLVGLVYSYYAPPGAQLCLTNPLLVRSHDFTGPEGSPAHWRHTELSGSGWPESAGGRLTGSLIALPYALAEAEQNFLTPKREQALIWADLVPQIIAGVTVNRWRNVTPAQVRWVSLHLQRGRALLVMAALNAQIETRVLDSLRAYLQPSSVEWIDDHLLMPGDFENTAAHVPSSVLYAIAADPTLQDIQPDWASLEIALMTAKHQAELQPAAIGRTFGTPKPTLTHSYRPGLLYLRTFPALMGYSSRVLAESWESNNLYYAALADEAGVPAGQLDAYVPEWNRAAIENIFATHLEDWPALLRSLDALGANVRQHGAQVAAMNGAGN